MKKIILLMVLLLVPLVSASNVSSGNYSIEVGILDGFNNNVSSTNYSVETGVEDVSGKTTSGNYSVSVGFINSALGGEADITIPTIYLASPANNSATSNLIIAFRFWATDNIKLGNCSLNINGNNVSTTGMNNNTNTTIIYTLTTANNVNWIVYCDDNSGNTNFSDNRTLIVNIPSTGGASGAIISGTLPNNSCDITLDKNLLKFNSLDSQELIIESKERGDVEITINIQNTTIRNDGSQYLYINKKMIYMIEDQKDKIIM